MPGSTPSEQAAPREPRGARRKRRTRDKLLRAAMALMADRGVQGVAINEITEAADVGFGSFYNHFESKESLHEALLEDMLEAFGSALEQIVQSLDDPAEVLATSIRCTLRQARGNPQWGQFLVQNGFAGRLYFAGLAQHVMRDLTRGVELGRFSVQDPLVALLQTGGTVIAAISIELAAAQPDNGIHRDARTLQLDITGIPERTSAAILRTLGVADGEAAEIARRPLPDVEFTPAHLATQGS